MQKVRYKSLNFLDHSNYRVGDDGIVWIRNDGCKWREVPPSNGDYLTVSLYNSHGKKVKYLVHHLVLFAFAGPRPDGMIGRHLNDVRHDNRLANLAWGTYKENGEDRSWNLAVKRGIKRHSEDSPEARKEYAATKKVCGPRIRTAVISFKAPHAVRRYIEQAAAFLTLRTGQKHSLTDVIEHALDLHEKKLRRDGMSA